MNTQLNSLVVKAHHLTCLLFCTQFVLMCHICAGERHPTPKMARQQKKWKAYIFIPHYNFNISV